ncbi:hypothetical protein D3C86_470310 [compost metagenome]
MISVSLTTFVDFVSKAGTPKFTVVRKWKNKEPYSPATDFYKKVRDEIVDIHENARPVSELDRLLSDLRDNRRLENYPEVIYGYKRWLGRKQPSWFPPPAATWNYEDLGIQVNPELGLEIDGQPHLIKLYFKSEPLTKNRVELITHLMSVACTEKLPTNCRMGVLDVRQSKLITPTVPVSGLTAQLQAEASYWLAAWPAA